MYYILFYQISWGTHKAAEEYIGSSHVIELRSDGFYPKDIQISKGESITFTTTRDRHFWPASNLHPTHSLYPEFDSEEPIGPENTWVFEFNEVGEWRYHDHLTPYFGGTVTVAGEGGIVKVCSSEEESVECWQKLLFQTFEKEGIDAVYDQVSDLYTTSEIFKKECHSVVHNIGLEAYKYYLEDNESILSPKTSACAYGFYHGFMEALLTTTESFETAREFCFYIDEFVTPYIPDATLQCFHGIGHGAVDLALATSGFGGDEKILVENSLRICEGTSYTEEEIYRCTSGVYNSLANIYVEEKYVRVRADDPLWLCREQPEAYKESCYGNMNSLMFHLAGNDLLEALPFINEIEDAHQVVSTRYLSGLSVVYTLLETDNYSSAIAICRGVNNNLVQPCLEGLVHGLLEHGAPGEEYIKAFNFCGSPVLTEEEQNNCFKYSLGNINGWYSLSKSKEICIGVKEEFQQYCKRL